MERLDLSSNQLETLPEGFGNLALLSVVGLHQNRLTTLPRSLIELPRDCEVLLDNNNIPPVVVSELSRALEVQRARRPGTGPYFEYSMPALSAQPTRSLPDEISSWYPESASRVASPAAWTQTITEAGLDQDSQAALSNMLGRLRSTAHYRVAQEDMKQRVHAIFEQLKSDKNALASCAAQAVEGTTTCDDRIALALLLMEETLLHHKAQQAATDPDGPQTLRRLGQGLYKSDVLKDIANRRVAAAVGFVDPTEYILKYWVKLSAELDLPCKLEDMIFHECATEVSDHDIHKARKEVRSAVRDAERFKRFLANWAPWETLLEHHLPVDHKEALERIENFRDTCHSYLEEMTGRLVEVEKEEGVSSAKYLDLIAEIGAIPQTVQNFKTKCFEALSEKLGDKRPS